MKPRIAPYHRALFLISAFALALFAIGCRPSVQVEGGLQPEAFLSRGATLTKDGAGRLFVVAARGQSPGRFALVKDAGQSHLFWARPVGERTAQLFPLTRFDIDWYNRAMGRRYVEFHDEIRDMALSDSLGLWRGGDEEALRWLGPMPKGRSRAVVMSAALEVGSPSLADFILGTVEVDASGAVSHEGTFPSHKGPYFVIVDGPKNEEAPRAAALTRTALEAPEGWVFVGQSRAAGLKDSATLAQRAGELGVEVIIAEADDTFFAGFAKDGAALGFGPLAQRPALVESGFLFPAASDGAARRRALQVLDDLYKGHPLSAAYHLARLQGWSVDKNPEATLLRHQDLIAAAGFIPWTRAAILEGREGQGPEASIYLSRAFIYAGHGPAVLAHAGRAESLFQSWPEDEGGALGLARAMVLESQGRLLTDDRASAGAALAGAQEYYERGGDRFRQAEAARALALLEPEGADFIKISDQFQDARASYEASRTLLLGGAIYLEDGEKEKVQGLLEAWEERFAPQAPQRLNLFYKALALRANRAVSEEPRALFEEARRAHAWEALLVLGPVGHGQHASSEGEAIRAFARQLSQARRRSSTSLFSRQVEESLRSICTDLVFSGQAGDEAGLDRHCLEQVATILDSAEGAQTYLDAGYRLLQQGELAGAATLAQTLLESGLDDDVLRARALFLDAAVLREQAAIAGESDSQEAIRVIQEGFDLLQGALAPREAPRMLKEMGDEFVLRGLDGHAITLYQASRQAAINANRTTAEFDAALHLAEALYEAGQWRTLAALSRVESPLHGARIQLYKAQANFALENNGTARELLASALEQAKGFGDLQRVSVLHLATTLARERGEAELAGELIAEAQRILEALPENVTGREEAQVLRAQTFVIRGQLNHDEGNPVAARVDLTRAFELFESLPPKSAPAVQQRLLEVAASTSQDSRELRNYLQRMQVLAALVQETAPLAAQGARARAARLELRLGDPGEAARALKSALASGDGVARQRGAHHCLLGEVFLSAGEAEQAERHLKACAGSEDPRFAERGQFLLAMADSTATASYRGELARHLTRGLGEAEEFEKRRLLWMAELVEPRRDKNEAEEGTLRADFQAAAQDGGGLSSAERSTRAVSYIDYLLDSAQYQEADRLLQSEAALFQISAASGESEWTRLRLTSLIRQLRPYDALELMERALSETGDGAEASGASIFYLRAAAYMQAGQDLAAAELLARAKQLALAGTPLFKEIRELESTLPSSR